MFVGRENCVSVCMSVCLPQSYHAAEQAKLALRRQNEQLALLLEEDDDDNVLMSE